MTRSKLSSVKTFRKSKVNKLAGTCDGHCEKAAKVKKQFKTSKTSKSAKSRLPKETRKLLDSDSEAFLDLEGKDLKQENPSCSNTITIASSEDTSEMTTVTFDDVAKLLSTQNEHFAAQMQDQIVALRKSLDKSNDLPSFSGANNIPLPKFSGAANEDVREFVAQFERAAGFYKFSEERKAQILPLLLTGHANLWLNSRPLLSGTNFDTLSKALIKQFHTESDVWLLRQQLSNRKQLATETVANFAADIRRISQRIKLPREESVNYFIQGLKPAIKNYVILQRPSTFEDAEMHAKLKESLPEPQPVDRTDEILQALAKMQTNGNNSQPSVAAYNAPYNNNSSQGQEYKREKPLGREEIAEIISRQVRQEVRRARNEQAHGQDYRNRRSFDGRPICNYCRKVGHIAFACRKRQADNRDPRIPFQARPRDQNPRTGDERRSFVPPGNQNLN